jgi:hypothetical protein
MKQSRDFQSNGFKAYKSAFVTILAAVHRVRISVGSH